MSILRAWKNLCGKCAEVRMQKTERPGGRLADLGSQDAIR